MSGQLGNKYKLLKKLAVGGMAEIFLAEQRGPGGFTKRLVIKRILEHLVTDPKFLEMFQDEARLAAGLNHPNIVQIFELDQDEGSYYIAMEYVHGYNLRAVIQNCNEQSMWLAPEYIAKLGSQICEGLEYAHNFCDSSGDHLNIIHRDVSPQNIILSNQGVIKIVDFGIAKAASNKVETQAGVIKGKLAYMSPEQVKGQKLDRRSDLFSLGIVLYELATHQRPFQGKSDLDILRAILESKPTPIETFRPEFPLELNHIIYRALAKNREERYSSARDLQWDLERFIQGWGKPIGPFQLQQLVTKLEEFTGDNQPAPQPTSEPDYPPAPEPHAQYDYDDDGDEDTVYNPTGLANGGAPSSAYGTNNTPSTPNSAYGTNNNTPSAPNSAYGANNSTPSYPPPGSNSWHGNNDDEWEEERTVMQLSPVSASSFPPAPDRRRSDGTDDDLVTIHESEQAPTNLGNHGGHSNNRPAPPPTLLDGQLPVGMLDPLRPVRPNPSAPTMLDRNLPNIPPPGYPNPPARSGPIPKPQMPPPANGSAGRSHQAAPSSQVTIDAVAFGHDVHIQPKPKGRAWPWIMLGLLLAGALGAGAYFLFVYKG